MQLLQNRQDKTQQFRNRLWRIRFRIFTSQMMTLVEQDKPQLWLCTRIRKLRRRLMMHKKAQSQLPLSHQTHLLKNILPILKLIHITFWFDGKFYSRTCRGVDLLSRVHTKMLSTSTPLVKIITKVNDWMQHPLAKNRDILGLHPETVTVDSWRKVSKLRGYIRGQSARSTTEVEWLTITEGKALLGSQRG